jgi:hypothetical protein
LILKSACYQEKTFFFRKIFGDTEKVLTFAIPIDNERVTNRKRKVETKSSLKILETVLSKAILLKKIE